MLLEGLHIPLTTPFHSDGRLRARKLVSNVERYSKTPAAGLIVLAPSAEPTLLSDGETREVLKTAAEAAAPEKVLTAGIHRDSVAAALTLAEYAAELDYDAILLPLPSILEDRNEADPSIADRRARERLLYFRTIADRSPLPILLFSGSASRLSTSAVIELAAHPRILGLIEAAHQPVGIAAILRATASIQREVTVTPVFAAVTARMAKQAAAHAQPAPTFISADTLAETYSGMLATFDAGVTSALLREPPDPSPAQLTGPPLRTRTKTVGFQIIAASAAHLAVSLRAGASGIAPPLSAAAPQACYEVYAAWKDGDQLLADEKQTRLISAAQLAEDSLGPGGLKHACDLNGYYGGPPRPPYLPPTGDERSALESLMQDLGN